MREAFEKEKLLFIMLSKFTLNHYVHVALEIFYVQNFSRLLEKERARYENGVEEE